MRIALRAILSQRSRSPRRSPAARAPAGARSRSARAAARRSPCARACASRSASAGASSSASDQLSGPAGVASGAGSTTLRHCTMRWRRIRKAVLASPPTPAPQRPGPGRSVRRKSRDHERARVLGVQDLRAAGQGAVEEAHVVAAREPDRRGAVRHDARDREVAAPRARRGRGGERVGPAADDGHVGGGSRLARRRGRGRRGRRGGPAAAAAASASGCRTRTRSARAPRRRESVPTGSRAG